MIRAIEYTGVFDITKYVDQYNDKIGWTEAFRQAISDAEKAGGGVIYVPPGKYSTFSIQLKSNMTLYLSNGAELDFIDEISGYETVMTEFEGILREAYMPCIYAYQAQNVSVKGDSIINGNGCVWWEAFENGELTKARPYLICFQECENVKIEKCF